MSKFKYSNQLFLGKQELDRTWKFIVDDGYRRHLLQNTYSFGIVREVSDTSFDAFKIQSGTNPSTIKVPRNSYAINADGLVIYKAIQDNIAIPNDSAWYWIRVSHEFTALEQGTVSVDGSGNLTGVGTKFTEVLRGQPNNPARIKFNGASLNILEYEVVEVINDTNAVLSGVFQVESNLQYAVFGTFTPGVTPSTPEQYPFQYDSCQFDIIAETVSNTPPATVADYDFILARVRSVGGILEIQDKRSQIWKTKADYEQTTVDKDINPLIGIEAIRYDHAQGTKEKNQIKLAWGFRSTNYTYDSSLRRLTINSGEGGKFKSTADFTTGDFNGWLVYDQAGTYRKVLNSTKTGSDINLFLDILNPDDKYDSGNGEEILVVPDVEEVEFKFGPDTAGTVVEQVRSQVSKPVKDGVLYHWQLVPADGYKLNIQWRHKRANEYSEWRNLPSDYISAIDTTRGYYNETSFDSNGVLSANPADRTRQSYQQPVGDAGYIPLKLNPNTYANFQSSVITGDVFGATNVVISNSNPVTNLKVGVASMIQYITGSITLSTNQVFNLDPAGAVEGNEFTLIFDANVTPAGWGITINTGYVNAGTPGTYLHYFTPTDLDYMKMPRKKFVFKARFVNGAWIGWIVEEDTAKLGDIKMFSSEVDLTVNTNFDSTGKGVSDDYLGWALCNGQNGTHDLRERFIAGSNYGTTRDGDYGTVAASEFATIGSGNGAHSYKLTAAQSGLPSHTHAHTLAIESDGSHTHPYSFDRNHDNNGGGPYHIQGVTARSNSADTNGAAIYDAGSHTHGITGSITAAGGTDAAAFHENRPKYIALGFIQRVPFPGGTGGPGGSITYPKPAI